MFKKTKTVESILGSMLSKVDELDTLRDTQEAEAVRLQGEAQRIVADAERKAEELLEEAADLHAAAKRAGDAADRFSALLHGEAV